MNRININLPYEEVLKRKERWNKAINFEKPDRVPVLHYIGSRYWLPLIGFAGKFSYYYKVTL